MVVDGQSISTSQHFCDVFDDCQIRWTKVYAEPKTFRSQQLYAHLQLVSSYQLHMFGGKNDRSIGIVQSLQMLFGTSGKSFSSSVVLVRHHVKNLGTS